MSSLEHIEMPPTSIQIMLKDINWLTADQAEIALHDGGYVSEQLTSGDSQLKDLSRWVSANNLQDDMKVTKNLNEVKIKTDVPGLPEVALPNTNHCHVYLSKDLFSKLEEMGIVNSEKQRGAGIG